MKLIPYLCSRNHYFNLNSIRMKKETIDQLCKAFEQYALEVNAVNLGINL